jgi:molybdenum cofactor cytidylyltransferase
MTSDPSNRNDKTAIIILAAGASVRMGTPKQLLKVNGVSLVRRAAQHALDCACGPVVVVLGANAGLIKPELDGLAVEIAVNEDWRSGMSSSIRCGVTASLTAHPAIERVVLFLADQPNVTEASLRKLTTADMQCGSSAIAASYSGHIGTPALFSRCYFDELCSIEGEGGAKKILKRHANEVLPIDFPEAEFDLDTPAAFASFTESQVNA